MKSSSVISGHYRLLGVFLLIIVLLFLPTYYLFSQSSLLAAQKNSLYLYQQQIARMKPDELSQFFTRLARDKGALYAYKVLNEVKLPQGAASHFLAHDIGYELYKQYGTRSISLCPSSFGYGCIHTASIEFFLHNGVNAINKLAEECYKDFPNDLSRGSCYHGLGHGVLAYTEYDLINGINLCTKLKDYQSNDNAYTLCFSGAMMEMVSGIHDPKHWAKQFRTYFSQDSPLAPCDTSIIPSDLKRTCYTYITPYLLSINSNLVDTSRSETFKSLMSLCMDIPKNQPQNRDGCFGGFGRSFLTFVTNGDFDKINHLSPQNLTDMYEWCRLSQDKAGLQSCIKYVVFTVFLYDKLSPTVPARICNSIRNTDDRSYCFEKAIQAVSMLRSDLSFRQEFCTMIDSYDSSCKKLLHT